MPIRKVVICLANSRKHNGRCVAGVEIVGSRPAGWIRPVSNRPGAEVSDNERRCRDGSEIQVLDRVSMSLVAAAPHGYQSENWILDPTRRWTRAGRATWTDLSRMESSPVSLWTSDAPSTHHGVNDRVPADTVDRFADSLRLIRVGDFVVRVFAPGAAFENPKRRVQGSFTYLRNRYRLWVTDPVIEKAHLARPDGDYPLGESYLTISLGERADDGYCYKLIAAAITRDRAGKGR